MAPLALPLATNTFLLLMTIRFLKSLKVPPESKLSGWYVKIEATPHSGFQGILVNFSQSSLSGADEAIQW